MSETHNPPAFPCDDTHSDFQGASLRDYFAGKALEGWLAAYAGCSAQHPASNEGSALIIANYSYAMADAMLKARALPAPPATPEAQS